MHPRRYALDDLASKFQIQDTSETSAGNDEKANVAQLLQQIAGRVVSVRERPARYCSRKPMTPASILGCAGDVCWRFNIV